VLQRLVVDPSLAAVAVVDEGELGMGRGDGHVGQDLSRLSGGS
jgi:hypothetical protein